MRDPNAIVIVTPTLTPNGGAFVPRNPNPLAVTFLAGTHNWAILNEYLAPMPLGAAFNVLVSPVTDHVFQTDILAFPDDPYVQMTIVSVHGKTSPDLVMVVTHVWNPGTPWNPHLVGVGYDNLYQEWL